MLKGVIFDMDGVLFDTERLTLEGWRLAAPQAGYPLDDAVVLSTNGISEADTRLTFLRHYGEAYPYDALRAEMKRYKDGCLAQGVPVKPGVQRLLQALRGQGIRTAVASSNDRVHVTDYLQRTGLLLQMDAFVCADMVRQAKPAPDVYLRAAEALGLPPESCIAIEDAPPGLVAARCAGCIPVMIPDLIPASAQDVTKHIFPSMDALLTHLQSHAFCI